MGPIDIGIIIVAIIGIFSIGILICEAVLEENGISFKDELQYFKAKKRLKQLQKDFQIGQKVKFLREQDALCQYYNYKYNGCTGRIGIIKEIKINYSNEIIMKVSVDDFSCPFILEENEIYSTIIPLTKLDEFILENKK